MQIGVIIAILALLYTAFIGQSSIPQILYWRFARGSERHIRQFWEIRSHNAIDIVCSSIPIDLRHDFATPGDRNYLRYAKFADLDTLIFVHANLARLNPRLTIRDFTSDEYFDGNGGHLIIIGGPPWNIRCGEISKALPYFFEANPLGEDDLLHIKPMPTRTFGPIWTESGKLQSDICVLSRIRLEHGRFAFLLVGCLTAGVMGAAKAILGNNSDSTTNALYLKRRVNDCDFTVVFDCNIHGESVVPANFKKRRPLVLMKRPHESSNYVVVE